MEIWIALLLVVVAVGAAVAVRRNRPLYKLTLREGETGGLDFPVRDREATIGSEEGQTIVVSHPRVSGHHAVLSREEGRVILRDRSTQGTSVNGRRVKEQELKSGDLISLADSVDLIFTRLR